MPLYADFYAYGPSPVFSATHYSALLYLGSSSGSSYSSRIGSFPSTSSWSPLPSSPRVLPSSRPRRFAPPALPTISETSCSLSSSPRLRSHYTAPRPIRIDTADIDVTSPRNRGPFDRSSDGSSDRKRSPKERAGNIRRGRTVVRLHTRRLKDGPPPSALAAVAKTPGERLVEKFYIRDSKETKHWPKAKDTAPPPPPPREVIIQPDEKKTEESEDEEDESSEEESSEEEEVIKVEVKKEGEKSLTQEEQSEVDKVDGSAKSKPSELLKETKVNDTGDSTDAKVDHVESQVLSLVDGFPSEDSLVMRKILSPEEKGNRVPKFVVGDVSIEVCHSTPPSLKPTKRLRMQVEVVVEGQENEDDLLSGVTAKTPGTPTTPSLPFSPTSIASPKPQPLKSSGDFPKLWGEKCVGTKVGEPPKPAKGVAKVGVSVNRKLDPTTKNQSSQVTPTIREGEKKKEEGISAKFLAEEVTKRVTPSESPTKKVQTGSNLKTLKEAEKQGLAAQNSTEETKNDNFRGKNILETPKLPAESQSATILSSKSPALAKKAKLSSLDMQEKASNTKESKITLITEAKETEKPVNLDTQAKILRNLDVKIVSQPIDIKDSLSKSKEATSSFSEDVAKTQEVTVKKAEDATQKSQKVDNKIPTTKAKEVIPLISNDKEKQNMTGRAEDKNISNLTEGDKGPSIRPKETPSLIKEQKEDKITEVGIKPIISPVGNKIPIFLTKEPAPQLSVEKVKEKTIAKDKVIDIAKKIPLLNTSKSSNLKAEKFHVTQNITDSATSPKKKLNAKDTNNFPLIIDNNQKTVNSETTFPLKMMKIPYPQKIPIPKVIEKPVRLLARLLDSEKQVEEPEKKTDSAKASEKIGKKELDHGTILAAASKASKEGKKDASKTDKEPTPLTTTSISQKLSSPITLETPTKDAAPSVNKSVGIKTESKDKPKPETVATKTKPKDSVAKTPQELHKPEAVATADLKVDKEKKKDEKAPAASKVASKDSKVSSKNREKKTQVSTDSAKDQKRQASPPVEAEAKANKVVNKDSPKTPSEASKTDTSETQAKVSNSEPPKVVVSESPKTSSKKTTPEKNKSSAKKESTIPPIIEPSGKEDMKEMKVNEKVVDAGTLSIPPVIDESEESDSEDDSEEDTEEESEEETESEDEEERQLRDEAIKRASIPGTSAAPAKSLPRFRDYHEKDFLFLRVLGKGSFGKVFLAVLRDSDRHYAIKCLKKQSVIEEEDVECTLIERKVLSLATAHPFLCHLYCTFQSETHLFFVMEYLNGGDLMFHIQRYGKFDQERAQFYAAEIVSGLKFLHKKSIVYRDLKLDNILLDYQGHIRIADFGMCKLQIFLDRTADTFCGTPDYIAPEIIKGYRYNQTVDWWSFGVLLYEMLVGQSPFTGCDEDELFWSICNESPLFPMFLSRDARDILARLLNKDADRRLGAHGCPAGDVCDQPFFRSIDWWRLERKEMEPPFRPALKHPLDLQYFETTFTSEKARLTPPPAKRILTAEDQEQFDGFSYTNPNATD